MTRSDRQASFITLPIAEQQGTFRASGMAGIEPMLSKSKDWTQLSPLPNYAKGVVTQSAAPGEGVFNRPPLDTQSDSETESE